MGNLSGNWLSAFACFACRKSFKRPRDALNLVRKCPNCDGVAVDLGRKFKPPSNDDLAAWKVVQFLYENGFPFFSIGKSYPSTIEAAKDFIEANSAHRLTQINVPVRRLDPKKPGRGKVVFVKVPWAPYENPEIK